MNTSQYQIKLLIRKKYEGTKKMKQLPQKSVSSKTIWRGKKVRLEFDDANMKGNGVLYLFLILYNSYSLQKWL